MARSPWIQRSSQLAMIMRVSSSEAGKEMSVEVAFGGREPHCGRAAHSSSGHVKTLHRLRPHSATEYTLHLSFHETLFVQSLNEGWRNAKNSHI